jgi:hypothetical protein
MCRRRPFRGGGQYITEAAGLAAAVVTAPTTMASNLCLACSSNVTNIDSQLIHKTRCCSRIICLSCLTKYPRLSTYDPCIACLGGVEVVRSAKEANRVGLTVGGVSVDDVYIIGDSDDEEKGIPEVEAVEPVVPSDDLRTPNAPPVSIQDDIGSNLASTSDVDKERARRGQNTEYWIKPGDSLVGIALKFGVNVSSTWTRNIVPERLSLYRDN